jgi:hypothetical protein
MARFSTRLIAVSFSALAAASSVAAQSSCAAHSGLAITPLLELYTSEGCSSCPPADLWVSRLKSKNVVVQAFHVGYWDYIGWIDRFAAPAYTQRQRDIAAQNGLQGIYTPQLVLNGQDWPQWRSASTDIGPPGQAARVKISLQQTGDNRYEALVTPLAGASNWSAYWTVTEHGHNSKVKVGENAGEFLQHDYVVRQYIQAGDYKTTDGVAQKLTFLSIPPTPGHPRQVNLVVQDNQSGKPLQALSLLCPG